RLTALRCTGAALGLLVVLGLSSPRRLRVRPRDLPFLAAFGIVGVAATQFLYYVAIGRLPVGIALVFEMTAPVFIALYVRVLGRSVAVPVGGAHLPLWTLVLWIAVLGALVPFWLSIAALPHLSPTTAGLVATVEPVFAAAVAWLALGQVLSGWQVAGGVVV